MDNDKKMTLDELFEGTFMKELLAEDLVQNEPKEDIDIERGEEVIGEMTELERRLFAFSSKCMKIGGGIHLKVEYESLSREEEANLMEAMANLASIGKAVKKLLWATIRDRLVIELAGPYSVGVRREFKIVRFEDRSSGPPRAIEDLLRLLGR
jgi:hypothetical protein